MVPKSGPTSSGHRRTNSAFDTSHAGHNSSFLQEPRFHRHSANMHPSPSMRARHHSASTKSVPPLHSLLPSAPASPPTPAPSPTPLQIPSWQTAMDDDDTFLRQTATEFGLLRRAERQRFLAELLNLCDSPLLSFVHQIVTPRLRKDPFESLPNELCLRILAFIDDPKTLARSSQVSRRWHDLVNDDLTWKVLCDKHSYRRMSEDRDESFAPHSPPHFFDFTSNLTGESDSMEASYGSLHNSLSSIPPTIDIPERPQNRKQRAKTTSYRYHFKQRYMVDTLWKKGGQLKTKYITPDHGVVTSLHLTSKYIVVALDNAKIHIFDAEGEHQKTLHGHVMGVWAMVPWDDLLVSGGCDRDVRVWDMSTGTNIHKLRGHTSTVRCLKMSDKNTAISGSRDTTLRVWDLEAGVCKTVLAGHQASVRCLEVHGDLVVSGSYDTTAKVWSISEGRCLRSLTGHFSQIYAVVFDGKRVATGSLDTSVRIWDPHTGQCHAILQGHTSLVGQIQMCGDTLVTGGSDGSIRIWSLQHMAPIHRLAAHDNSITCLQSSKNRIVSGGSDGRVKIWDLQTGQLLRELSQPAESVWRVAFEDEKAVIMATRGGRTVMEVWSFAPPKDEFSDHYRTRSLDPEETTLGRDSYLSGESEDVEMSGYELMRR